MSKNELIGSIEQNAVIDRQWALARQNLYDCTCINCPPKHRARCSFAWDLKNIKDVCINADKLDVRQIRYKSDGLK